MAGADGNALGVQDGAHVVGVGVFHDEGEDAALVPRGADETHRFDFGQLLGTIGQQFAFVGGDVGHAQAVHVVNGDAQADAAGDVLGAGLKLGGNYVVEGLLESNGANHLAAALVGRHSVQQVGAAIEGADAGGAVELMAGEDVEVAADALHIYRYVGDGLGAVQQDGDAAGVGQLHDLLRRVDGAEGIGLVDDGHQLGAVSEQLFVLVQQQLAVVVDGDDLEVGALFLAQNLPRDDVGVMLHSRNDDFIALAYVLPP